jgi:hypothetical protein
MFIVPRTAPKPDIYTHSVHFAEKSEYFHSCLIVRQFSNRNEGELSLYNNRLSVKTDHNLMKKENCFL